MKITTIHLILMKLLKNGDITNETEPIKKVFKLLYELKTTDLYYFESVNCGEYFDCVNCLKLDANCNYCYFSELEYLLTNINNCGYCIGYTATIIEELLQIIFDADIIESNSKKENLKLFSEYETLIYYCYTKNGEKIKNWLIEYLSRNWDYNTAKNIYEYWYFINNGNIDKYSKFAEDKTDSEVIQSIIEFLKNFETGSDWNDYLIDFVRCKFNEL